MSRKVHIEDSCTLRFPGRSADFAAGVEVGILTAQMDSGQQMLSRWVGTDNIDQLRTLGTTLGYRLTTGETDGEYTYVTLTRGSARPRLRIVHPARD